MLLGYETPATAVTARGRGHQPREVDDVPQVIARLFAPPLPLLAPVAGQELCQLGRAECLHTTGSVVVNGRWGL